MLSRIAAIMTLFSGLFADRNQNRPPPVPVADRSVPMAARKFAPKGGTPRRRTYMLPAGERIAGGSVPGSWRTVERVPSGAAFHAAHERAEAKRTARNARRVRDALASKRGAALSKIRIETESDEGRSGRRAGGVVHFDMEPLGGWYPARRGAWLGILSSRPYGAQS